ncbi:MAG: hypothetical protein KA479_07190, partial [Saprospiraceae bacterium]|nr:hypothetical protein [Saprospiraceae bacterium]
YGFPKMSYKPEILTQFGGHIGLAIRPWSKVQAGVQIQNARYLFTDSYASASTEPNIDLRKTVSFSLLNISLTYRHHLISSELTYVGTEKSIELALQKKHSFFLLAGPQLGIFRSVDVQFSKRNAGTGNTWQASDLKDIKPAFDNYVPIDLIPDQLPEDRKDLYQSMVLSLLGGVGWNMHLAPGFSATLEASASITLNDFNSSDRNNDGTYIWRRRVYSGEDPKTYFSSSILNFTLGVGMHYTF